MENFPKLIKCAGWNKGVQVGIFQKINKICCMIIREVRVICKIAQYCPMICSMKKGKNCLKFKICLWRFIRILHEIDYDSQNQISIISM